MPLGRLLALRDFLVIWAGQSVSIVGSRLSSFALGIWVLRTTGSTTYFAMIFVAMTIPALMVSVIAGPLVDRWDRRLIMIVCDVFSSIAMLGLIVLGVKGNLSLWYIYAAVTASSLFDAFRLPAFAASIPLLAPQDQLPRVNGMAQTGNAIAEIIAPLLAGALMSWISLQGILLVDALTFAIGAATLSMVRIPPPVASAAPHREGILREAAIGWRYVHARPGLLGLLAIYGWNNFIFSIACVLIAPLLLSFADPVRLGVQYAVGGVGLLLGGVAMATWGGPRKRINGVLAFSAIGGLFLAMHGLRPSFMLITVAGFVLFLTMPVISASSNSLWQSKVPAQLQGRCFAMQRLLFNLVTVLGYCSAGPLSQRIFEPLLAQGGALAGSIGLVIGVGMGRGIALVFMALGLLMVLAAIAAYNVPAIRLIDEMPDAFFFPGEAITPTAGRQPDAVKA